MNPYPLSEIKTILARDLPHFAEDHGKMLAACALAAAFNNTVRTMKFEDARSIVIETVSIELDRLFREVCPDHKRFNDQERRTVALEA